MVISLATSIVFGMAKVVFLTIYTKKVCPTNEFFRLKVFES